ncbi:MAG: hypothetical protein HC860_14065 [Alkalinema sp. RU_4_3]|nr:hypothetical protein [Alkalinema sp. RU_4_3]
MHARILLKALLGSLTLIALTATVARSDWHHHRRNNGLSGRIYIQGSDRTVIRERTTVIGPGGDQPTVILRESEIVQPGSFGGTVIYGDRYSQPYDYRYDPFYRRTVERYPIGSSGFDGIPSITPSYQVPIHQRPIFPSRTIIQSCTIQIDGTSNCP